MFRSLVFLLGTAILGAFMAGVYYGPDSVELKERATSRNLAPGDVQQDGIQPSLAGSDIVYTIEVLEGTIDVYVMQKEWATDLALAGDLHLDRPFSYYAALSATHVNGTHTFTIQSDGVTWYSVVLENADNYYAGDAGEGDGENASETARLRVTARFLEEERRSLTFGYIAAAPSVLLVAVTLGRQAQRWRRRRRASAAAERAPTADRPS